MIISITETDVAFYGVSTLEVSWLLQDTRCFPGYSSNRISLVLL